MPYRNKSGDIISDAQFKKLALDEKKGWTYQDDGEEDSGYDSGLEDEDNDFELGGGEEDGDFGGGFEHPNYNLDEEE